MIRVKRVHDQLEAEDGPRFLVDRLWPRGMKKENLQMDGWLKDVAPSDALRRWFGHDPAKWEEFCRRYDAELENDSEAWRPLLDMARKQYITLLYSAHDIEHNNLWQSGCCSKKDWAARFGAENALDHEY